MNEIETFENESIKSLDINQFNSKNVQDFLAACNKFYEEWDGYLKNFKILEEKVIKANEIANNFQNKISIYKKKVMNLIFNDNILYFKKEKDDLINSKFGVLNRSTIGKINFDEMEVKNYEQINCIQCIRFFYEDKILLNYLSDSKIFLEIRDGDMNSIAIKIFGISGQIQNFRFYIMDKFIIVYYVLFYIKYLVKFDKDLRELKKIESEYELCDLKASQDFIYGFHNTGSYCEICVFNDEFNVLYRLGQSKSPEYPFYLTSEIRGFYICRNFFYFIYMDKVNIVDEETGNIVKVIEVKTQMITMDSTSNFYILNIYKQVSMIFVYDFNGDLLDQIQLINSPNKIKFFVDNQKNARFILNDNKITSPFKFFPDYF